MSRPNRLLCSGRAARGRRVLTIVLFLGAALVPLGSGAADPPEEAKAPPVLLAPNVPLLSAPLHSALEQPAQGDDESQGKPQDKEADTTADEDDEDSPVTTAPSDLKAVPLPPLSPEMTALRGAIQQTLGAYARQTLNTAQNTPAHLLHVCEAFGCDGQVRQGGATGDAVNSVTCLCWNYPCAGYELLRTVEGRIAPALGYALQEQPGQFLAVLALARVPREYPVRAGEKGGKVDDLVAYEKLSCRDGADQSLKLIGLARFLPTDAVWKNDLGEEWSIKRMIRQELARSGDAAPEGGTHRLFALSYAVDRRLRRKEPLDEPFRRAKEYVEDFQDYAFELQNPDGTWHPAFFAYRGQGGTAVEQLRSTGHILRWLVFSLPESRLQDPRVVRSVHRVTELLGGRSASRDLSAASAREIAARMVALHALSIYDRRVFGPYDRQAAHDAALRAAEVSAKPQAEAPRR